MALVHDLSEAIVGDITPFDGISKAEKHKREVAAMKHICGLIEDFSPAGSSYFLSCILSKKQERRFTTFGLSTKWAARLKLS